MTRESRPLRRRRRDGGQTLMIFALAFALFLFALVCLIADAAFMFDWSGRVQAAAQLAAQSGADAIDPRYLYGATQPCESPQQGTRCLAPIVDISGQDRTGSLYAFERACIQAGDQSGAVPRRPPSDLSPKTAADAQEPEGTACASDGCRVWADVTRLVDLPIPFPGFPSRVPVQGTAFAAPVVGTTQAAAGCTGGRWVPAPPP